MFFDAGRKDACLRQQTRLSDSQAGSKKVKDSSNLKATKHERARQTIKRTNICKYSRIWKGERGKNEIGGKRGSDKRKFNNDQIRGRQRRPRR